MEGRFDEWNDNVCGRFGGGGRGCNKAVCGQKCGVGGDAKTSGECNFDVGEMRSAVDATSGIVVVTSDEKVNLS